MALLDTRTAVATGDATTPTMSEIPLSRAGEVAEVANVARGHRRTVPVHTPDRKGASHA